MDRFRRLLKSKYSLSKDREIVAAMVGFAEAGIGSLHDEFKKTSEVDLARLSV